MTRKQSKGWDIHRGRYSGTNSDPVPVLFDGAHTETSRGSRVAELRVSDGQWRERAGNVDPRVYVSHLGTSVEQKIKLPVADKAYVSNSDGSVVVCGAGFPGGCRIPNIQISPAKAEKRASTIGPRSWGKGNSFPCEEKH